MFFRDLEGKVAVVTGASRGLGRGIALGLARAGVDVVAASRKLEQNQSLVAEIESLGRRALALSVDLQSTGDIAAMMEQAADTFGTIDILVNNAGTSPINTDAMHVEEWAWDKILDTNLKGLFFCSVEAARCMTRRKRGKIINITSAAGKEGSPFLAPYGASKAAVIQLTRTLAIEWAPHNIHVNAIGPATFEVGVSEPVLNNEALAAAVIAKTPLGRIGEVRDLIGAVLLFASEASDYITGQTLFVDGGWLA